MVSIKDLIAELIGTFILVFAITTAIVAGISVSDSFGLPNIIAIALTAGLTLAALAYSFGPVSGGHFNPAVTISLWFAGKFPAKKVLYYVSAQFLGGILASTILFGITGMRQAGATTTGSFGLEAALIVETIATALFVIVILSVTSNKETAHHAPLAIGFYLLVAHLYAIPFSGSSLNPARSLGPALVTGGAALTQLWIYFVGPIIGGLLGALVFRHLLDK